MSSICPVLAKQLSARRISRQRGFLLLELLIALCLTTIAALPLAQLPLQAYQEQIKTLYRSQSQRLADSGLSKLKEMLYHNEIPWHEITKSSQERIVAFEDDCDLQLPPSHKKSFHRRVTLKCVSKKMQGTEEWWLMVARIKLTAKHQRSKTCAYYLVLHKTS